MTSKASEYEEARERGERASHLPSPAETHEVIERVLQHHGVSRNRDKICRQIQLSLTRNALKRPMIEIEALLDLGFDKVNKYVYKSMLAFGAGICDCKTFSEFRAAMNKRDFYPTVAEWRAAVVRLGITSNPEYRKRHKEDPRLPYNPCRFYGVARWNQLMQRVDKYKSVEEWRAVTVDRLGITNHREYTQRHKEDPRLYADLIERYGMKWNELIGREYYKTLRQARAATRRLGITNSKEYNKRRREAPKLPSSPTFYGKDKKWRDFSG